MPKIPGAKGEYSQESIDIAARLLERWDSSWERDQELNRLMFNLLDFTRERIKSIEKGTSKVPIVGLDDVWIHLKNSTKKDSQNKDIPKYKDKNDLLVISYIEKLRESGLAPIDETVLYAFSLFRKVLRERENKILRMEEGFEGDWIPQTPLADFMKQREKELMKEQAKLEIKKVKEKEKAEAEVEVEKVTTKITAPVSPATVSQATPNNPSLLTQALMKHKAAAGSLLSETVPKQESPAASAATDNSSVLEELLENLKNDVSDTSARYLLVALKKELGGINFISSRLANAEDINSENYTKLQQLLLERKKQNQEALDKIRRPSDEFDEKECNEKFVQFIKDIADRNRTFKPIFKDAKSWEKENYPTGWDKLSPERPKPS